MVLLLRYIYYSSYILFVLNRSLLTYSLQCDATKIKRAIRIWIWHLPSEIEITQDQAKVVLVGCRCTIGEWDGTMPCKCWRVGEFGLQYIHMHITLYRIEITHFKLHSHTCSSFHTNNLQINTIQLPLSIVRLHHQTVVPRSRLRRSRRSRI